jgi:K+-transporting ATPase ATPase A chain
VTPNGVLQIVLYLILLLALVKPIGLYMANVYERKATPLDRVLGPVERAIYRLCGVSPADEMGWRTYTVAILLFMLAGVLFLYALLRLGDVLPLNPEGFAGMSPDLAFNTAVSFVTNTNWQNYGGEATLGYLPQMAGLTVQNFLSAAVGMAICVALIRGFTRHHAKAIGNFWVDLTRGILYILLPLALVLALVLVSQGVVQTLSGYVSVPLLQPVHDAQGNVVTQQVIALGPANQWGRLLQRQCGPSVREPDSTHGPSAYAGPDLHRRRIHLHLRAHGGRHASGLGYPGGHAGDPGERRLRDLCRRGRRQS